jgi:hypothetical protein
VLFICTEPSEILKGKQLFRAGAWAVVFLARLVAMWEARREADRPREVQEALDSISVGACYGTLRRCALTRGHDVTAALVAGCCSSAAVH